MRRALLVCALSGLALTGCDTSGSPQDAMRATVSTFLASCASQTPRLVLPELLPPAKDVFIGAHDIVSGCATILRLPPPAGVSLARSDFDTATARVRSFGGGDGEVDVRVAGQTTTLRLSYSREGWQIEGPGQ